MFEQIGGHGNDHIPRCVRRLGQGHEVGGHEYARDAVDSDQGGCRGVVDVVSGDERGGSAHVDADRELERVRIGSVRDLYCHDVYRG